MKLMYMTVAELGESPLRHCCASLLLPIYFILNFSSSWNYCFAFNGVGFFFVFFLFFSFNYLYFPTKLPGITQLLSVFPPGWIDFDFLCSHSRILNYHLQFCAQRNRMLSDNPGTQRADFSPIYFLSLVTFRLNWSLGAALKMNRVSARFSKHYLWETCIDCWASSVTNDDSLGAKHYLPILNAMWL